METNKTLFETSALIEIYKKSIPVSGFTTIFNLIEFPKASELKLKILFPKISEYLLAYKISKSLLEIGKPMPIADILTASIAFSRDLTIIAKDRHFLSLKKILPELKVSVKNRF